MLWPTFTAWQLKNKPVENNKNRRDKAKLEKNFSQLAIKEVLPSELLGNGKQTTKKFTLLQLCPQRPFYEGSECKVNICQNYFKMVSGFSGGVFG